MNSYRKANAVNLVVGAALILLGVGGIANLISSNLVGTDIFWAIFFIFILVLVGGYETGKYSEARHEQRKSTK